jgi:hypothetical protein
MRCSLESGEQKEDTFFFFEGSQSPLSLDSILSVGLNYRPQQRRLLYELLRGEKYVVVDAECLFYHELSPQQKKQVLLEYSLLCRESLRGLGLEETYQQRGNKRPWLRLLHTKCPLLGSTLKWGALCFLFLWIVFFSFSIFYIIWR